MSFKVYSERCKTCIFGANSPVSPERFADLKAQWESESVVQECHQSTMRGQHIGCFGHYAAAKNGGIPHPIAEIMVTLGFPSDMPIAQMMHIAEQNGWVVFEQLPED